MAYCRWSSDNWKSDVYVYEGCDNLWHIHVAGSRRLGLDTLPPDPLSTIAGNDNAPWIEAYNKHRKALEELPFEDITLPHAGKSLSLASAQECSDYLKYLRDLGFHVPDGVIETLELEQKEIDNGETKGLPPE